MLKTLFTIFRWNSKYALHPSAESSHKNGESSRTPTLTVEGRGKGFAVVQMKNTFYTTDNNILHNILSEADQSNKMQSQALHEAFNLDTTVELLEAYKGVPPTRLQVKSCQR